MNNGGNMSFIDNIKENFSQSEIPKEPIFRAVLFGESAGYFENIKSIVSYTEEEIVLALSNGTLKINGKNLYIKKYCMGAVVVCGKIKKVERA